MNILLMLSTTLANGYSSEFLLNLGDMNGETLVLNLPSINIQNKMGTPQLQWRCEQNTTLSYVDCPKVAYGINENTPYSGSYTQQDKNGNIVLKGTFLNGLKTGTWTVVHAIKNETVTDTVHYKIGVKSGEFTRTYETGQKSVQGRYKDNLMQGVWQSWFKHGQQQAEIRFVNSQREGVQIVWHPNGQKCMEAIFSGEQPKATPSYWTFKGEAFEPSETKSEHPFKEDTLYTNADLVKTFMSKDNHKKIPWCYQP